MEDIDWAAIRVKFGARDDDTMPLSWCERGLTFVHEKHPQIFAAMMLAIIGFDGTVTKKRKS